MIEPVAEPHPGAGGQDGPGGPDGPDGAEPEASAVDWYEGEEKTRTALAVELRRIITRTRARPWRVILLTALLTTAVTFKIARRAKLYEADVVLAMTESSLSPQKTGIPYDELKQYVDNTLINDGKILEIVERRNLYRLRRRLGNSYAITELRDQLEIEVWKNSFVYYTDDEDSSLKSARIGITVADLDPDLAAGIAHDLAAAAIETHEERRLQSARRLASQLEIARDNVSLRLVKLDAEIAQQQSAIDAAAAAGQRGRVAGLMAGLGTLTYQRKESALLRSQILASPDALADKVAESGLGTTLEIVDERHPDRHERTLFAMILVTIVIGTGSLIGAALVLGAFDSRIHDADDVTRLGVPMLGQVPAFPGSSVSSLRARGAAGASQVSSGRRWRSRQ